MHNSILGLACAFLLVPIEMVASPVCTDLHASEDSGTTYVTCAWYIEQELVRYTQCIHAQKNYNRDRFARALAEQLSMSSKNANATESAYDFGKSVYLLTQSISHQETRWVELNCKEFVTATE